MAKKKDTAQLEADVVKAAMAFRLGMWFGYIYQQSKGHERKAINALDKACVALNVHRLDAKARLKQAKKGGSNALA